MSIPSEDNQDETTQEGETSLPPPTQEQQPTSTTPEDAPSSTSELPPEAQGEVNGGPLGCCLGITIGLLLSLSVAIVGRLLADPLAGTLNQWLSPAIRIIMFLVAAVGATICGYLGWKIGKRVYREYELSPRQKQKLERLEKKYRQR